MCIILSKTMYDMNDTRFNSTYALKAMLKNDMIRRKIEGRFTR